MRICCLGRMGRKIWSSNVDGSGVESLVLEVLVEEDWEYYFSTAEIGARFVCFCFMALPRAQPDAYI